MNIPETQHEKAVDLAIEQARKETKKLAKQLDGMDMVAFQAVMAKKIAQAAAVVALTSMLGSAHGLKTQRSDELGQSLMASLVAAHEALLIMENETEFVDGELTKRMAEFSKENKHA